MELGLPRDEMLSRMTSREITDWIAFAKIRSEEREAAERDRGRH
jgi:hypothetical protein